VKLLDGKLLLWILERLGCVLPSCRCLQGRETCGVGNSSLSICPASCADSSPAVAGLDLAPQVVEFGLVMAR